MFIGHLTGAYLIYRTATPNLDKLAFAAAMVGAIAPDVARAGIRCHVKYSRKILC